MSEAPGQCLPANEDYAISAVSSPLGRSSKDVWHVYANVKQGSSNKPRSKTSTTAKTPKENTDEADDRHHYVYAVIDKTKGKKQKLG